MARTWMVLALVFGCVVGLSGWSDAAVLYAADGSGGHLSSLVILNQSTGAVTSVVGPIGFAVTGLAIHPVTGLLYGSTARFGAGGSSLILIDKNTGLGTLIGAYGIPGGSTMPDLTFTSDGILYGWGQPINALHTINLATGHATRVGTFDFGATRPLGSGIAATTTSLILASNGLEPIFRVDRNTGVATSIAVLDWPRGTASGMGALAFGPGGVLFAMGLVGFQAGDGTFLVQIDLTTGHVTELGPTIPLGEALAFDPPTFPPGPSPVTAVPTLSELGFALLALLLMAVAVYRIRHRRVYQA